MQFFCVFVRLHYMKSCLFVFYTKEHEWNSPANMSVIRHWCQRVCTDSFCSVCVCVVVRGKILGTRCVQQSTTSPFSTAFRLLWMMGRQLSVARASGAGHQDTRAMRNNPLFHWHTAQHGITRPWAVLFLHHSHTHWCFSSLHTHIHHSAFWEVIEAVCDGEAWLNSNAKKRKWSTQQEDLASLSEGNVVHKILWWHHHHHTHNKDFLKRCYSQENTISASLELRARGVTLQLHYLGAVCILVINVIRVFCRC